MTNKVKVLTVITRMNVGGPAKLLADLINYSNSEVIDHEILTGHCEQNEVDFLSQHSINCKVTYLPTKGRNISLFNEVRTLITLGRYFRKTKPDIIHTHTSKAGLLGRLAAIIFFPSAQRIHTFHGHLLYGYFSPIKTSLIIWMEKFLSVFTYALVAVSNQIKIDLMSKGIGREEKWSVIPPSVINVCEPQSKEKEYSLVWVGRFTQIKDPFFFLSVVLKLADDGILSLDSPAIMVGGGELLEDMQSFAQSHKLPITFLGWVEDSLPVISKSRLLVITSRNEGLPVVMLEAASVGVPTISPKIGGIPDFIKDKITGFFAHRDVLEFSDYLKNIIQREEMLSDVGEEAQRIQRMNFSIQRYAELHTTLYLESAF